MKNKLQKIEDKLNELLLSIWNAIIAIVHKIIPQSVFDKLNKLKSKNKQMAIKGLQKSKSALIKSKDQAVSIKDRLMHLIDRIQKFPIKEKFADQLLILKVYLLETPLKSHVLWLSKKLNKLSQQWGSFADKIGRQQLAIAFGAFFMISFGIFSIYDSSQTIYRNEFNHRAPASAQEYDEKPDYYMYERKTATIYKVTVPIFQESITSVHDIKVDFTVRTSTRFAKKYLEFHTQKLKDFFYTRVEPVTSTFPLKEEGKLVLKEKIVYEVNNFLLKENVEGVVEEVNIIYIQAN